MNNLFDELSSIFKQSNCTPILIGGHALAAYGAERMTKDVDFIIDEDNFAELKELLSTNSWSEVNTNELMSRWRKTTNHESIDLLFSSKETMHSMLETAVSIKRSESVFMVPSIQNLIALKLHSLSSGKEKRALIDLPDIKLLVKNNPDLIKLNELKELCYTYSTADIYEEIIESIK